MNRVSEVLNERIGNDWIASPGGGSNMGSVPLSLKFLAPFREEEGNPRWTARTGDRDRDEESINQTVAASRDRSPAHGFAASPALMNEN